MKLTIREFEILESIKKAGKIRPRTIGVKLELKLATVQYNINRLEEMGLISRVGWDSKNIVWDVNREVWAL